MKVLVTGAAGFIGRYLVPALTAKGYAVVATDMLLPTEPAEKSVTWRKLDVSRPEAVYPLMLQEKPDYVIHLVSLLAAPCDADPIKGWAVNFQSTQYLLDAGMAYGLKRFVMTSSISVFGRGVPEPVQDNAVKEPATIYGQTKLACEHLMRWYQEKHGISCGAVRFPWVYGPGRETGITAMYSSKLLDALAHREPAVVTNPEEKGDWLYVRDAVKALLLLLETPNTPQLAYNIMGGLYSIREAMEIARAVCPGAVISYTDGTVSNNPYPLSYDDTPARRDLGWTPDYALERGIAEHIAMVRGQALRSPRNGEC